MYDIESIKALYSSHAVEYSQHFRSRMKERNIKFVDVRTVILNGTIIEQDLNDMPNPNIVDQLKNNIIIQLWHTV